MSKEYAFGICNWAMVVVATAITGYVLTNMFTLPLKSDWSPLARQGENPASPVSKVTSIASPVSGANPGAQTNNQVLQQTQPGSNAGVQAQPAGGNNAAARPLPRSVWDGDGLVAGGVPPTPNNRQLLPQGMENEDNAVTSQRRPIR